jgi:hypothetical protein
MKDILTAEEQFEFFCFAYLWRLVGTVPRFMEDYKNLWEQLKVWRDKFGQPWGPNAKHTLPAIEMLADTEVITKQGINIQLLKQQFNRLADYEFVVYP